jgi:cytidylate kinase
MPITVTIARQLGCGGSYLGQRLADNLSFRCLDREIISQTAKRLALDEEQLSAREERISSFWERALQGITGPPEAFYQQPVSPTLTDREVFLAESEVMKTIAAREDCVIVGRLASHILQPHTESVHLFLHAPLAFRIQRVIASGDAANEAQAREVIARSDESRRRFIVAMVGKERDDARNYDLCIDTSSLPMDDIAEFLTNYVRRKTGC